MNSTALSDAVQYIDGWLEYQFPMIDTTSLSVAIAHQSKIVFAKAFGKADIRAQRLATPQTVYRLASQSKMFTAVALLQLQESALLSIDDPVVKHLSWLRNHTDARWEDVTIRHLLSHSAGILRDGTSAGFWMLQNQFLDREQLRREILGSNLIIEPNQKMKYSNVGYGLLGLIIEAVSGETYNDYIDKKIIQLLRLERTTPELTRIMRAELAIGYTPKQAGVTRTPIEHSSTHALSPATGICSTPSDACRFVSALYGANDNRLLRQDSKNDMIHIHQSVDRPNESQEGYGLGSQINSIDSHRIYGHGGSFPGHRSLTSFDPTTQLAVSVAMNDNSIDPTLIVRSIYKCLYWFNERYVKVPTTDITRFSERFGSLWGVVDVIGYGNTLVELVPSMPLDFRAGTYLKCIDTTTLMVIESNSYGSLGEKLTYSYDENNKVRSVNRSGGVVLPLKKFQENLTDLSQISLT